MHINSACIPIVFQMCVARRRTSRLRLICSGWLRPTPRNINSFPGRVRRQPSALVVGVTGESGGLLYIRAFLGLPPCSGGGDIAARSPLRPPLGSADLVDQHSTAGPPLDECLPTPEEEERRGAYTECIRHLPIAR